MKKKKKKRKHKMNWNKQTIILALNSVKRANTQNNKKTTIALPVVVFLYYWNKNLERKTNNKKKTQIKLAFLLIFPLAYFLSATRWRRIWLYVMCVFTDFVLSIS